MHEQRVINNSTQQQKMLHRVFESPRLINYIIINNKRHMDTSL